MEKLKFYEVDKAYVSFLKKVDSKIPNIAYDKHDKFICGVLLNIDGMNYYAPISSFNRQQRTNILIKNGKGKVTSSIRLSFMFPVPNDQIRMMDFSKEEGFYKYLLMEELEFCNRHADEIRDKAEYIYRSVLRGDELMKTNCCDFKKLEMAYAQFVEEQKKQAEAQQSGPEDEPQPEEEPKPEEEPEAEP